MQGIRDLQAVRMISLNAHTNRTSKTAGLSPALDSPDFCNKAKELAIEVPVELIPNGILIMHRDYFLQTC